MRKKDREKVGNRYQVFTILMERELHESLRLAAYKAHRPMSDIVREAIRKMLKLEGD